MSRICGLPYPTSASHAESAICWPGPGRMILPHGTLYFAPNAFHPKPSILFPKASLFRSSPPLLENRRKKEEKNPIFVLSLDLAWSGYPNHYLLDDGYLWIHINSGREATPVPTQSFDPRPVYRFKSFRFLDVFCCFFSFGNPPKWVKTKPTKRCRGRGWARPLPGRRRSKTGWFVPFHTIYLQSFCLLWNSFSFKLSEIVEIWKRSLLWSSSMQFYLLGHVQILSVHH